MTFWLRPLFWTLAVTALMLLPAFLMRLPDLLIFGRGWW